MNEQKKKRERRKSGDFVKILLGDGHHAYARVLEDASFAFYDYQGSRQLSIQEIVALNILFQVAVMDFAITKNIWEIIGSLPLEEKLATPLPKFMQDILRMDSFSIYHEGTIRTATRSECIGLERMAVWDPEHVEDRLRDHFSGKENKWVKSLSMK